MALVQLKCPETGEPVDIGDVSPRIALMPQEASLWVREIPCPHCGDTHRWSSGNGPEPFRLSATLRARAEYSSRASRQPRFRNTPTPSPGPGFRNEIALVTFAPPGASC